MVDAKTPGFEARAMTNVRGKPNECQVFLDNVRVPASRMVGEKNRGWYILMGTLDILRSGISGVGASRRKLETLCHLYREGIPPGCSPRRDEHIEDLLAQLHVEVETFHLLAWRVVSAQAAGHLPNLEAAAASLVSKTLARQFAMTGMGILGNYGLLRRGSKRAIADGEVSDDFLESCHLQAGGTREILRTVIAQRGLGLPKG
jgi:alkylation response protein AidB-like acyl-CoA dehydrogenase